MSHGGINRGGGEWHPATQVTDGRGVWDLLLPPSNTRTAVADAALAATGAFPKRYTAVAGAVASGAGYVRFVGDRSATHAVQTAS